MDPDFWHARWQSNQIGFHEGAPNILLTAHFPALGIPAGGRIFVPLCGKSHDMRWFRAQGYSVAGAELSRMAVEQFFAELQLTPEITETGGLARFEAGGVTLFAGDIFELDQERLGAVDAVYDRAALVALPPKLRERYVAHLLALTNAAPQLLVTFEYEQERQPGPPFSITEADVRRYYSATHRPEQAGSREVPGGMKGICPAQEAVWLIHRPRATSPVSHPI